MIHSNFNMKVFPDIQGFSIPRKVWMSYLGVVAVVVCTLYASTGAVAGSAALCVSLGGFMLMDLIWERKTQHMSAARMKKSRNILALMAVALVVIMAIIIVS